jgi:hypothetical protein
VNSNWRIGEQKPGFSVANKIRRDDFILEPNGRNPRMGLISVPTDATKYCQVLE